ncbi:MAG: hypothetical protein QF662_07405, partial [Phycisphaerae bacterium]|nr:hypothetical protein [Phycisphaerae bacterium]
MATRLQTLAITTTLILSLFSLPAAAKAPQEIFDAKYGDDLKRVAATKSASDDIALAEELVADEAARARGEHVEVRRHAGEGADPGGARAEPVAKPNVRYGRA